MKNFKKFLTHLASELNIYFVSPMDCIDAGGKLTFMVMVPEASGSQLIQHQHHHPLEPQRLYAPLDVL
jgi:hypothetical protein